MEVVPDSISFSLKVTTYHIRMNGKVKYILMEIKIKRRTKREGSRRTKNSYKRVMGGSR
jgi:hypothetical protein